MKMKMNGVYAGEVTKKRKEGVEGAKVKNENEREAEVSNEKE